MKEVDQLTIQSTLHIGRFPQLLTGKDTEKSWWSR